MRTYVLRTGVRSGEYTGKIIARSSAGRLTPKLSRQPIGASPVWRDSSLKNRDKRDGRLQRFVGGRFAYESFKLLDNQRADALSQMLRAYP